MTDLAVLWFADPTGRVLASLPETANEADSAARVAEAWIKLDAADGTDR